MAKNMHINTIVHAAVEKLLLTLYEAG